MSTEAVPCMFTIRAEDGSLEERNGFLIRQLPQAVCNGPQAVTTAPATAILLPAPGTTSIQLLSSTGPSQRPTTSAPSTSTAGKSTRPNSLIPSSKSSKKAPLQIQPKPMSYGLSSANLNEPIQIATKVLLPVTAIQPILVAEPPVVQQTGSFVEVEHGQNPSCSVWNGFQTQPHQNLTYHQVYTTTSTSYENITQPTPAHTHVRISTCEEKSNINNINSTSGGYSPMKPPSSGLHDHMQNANGKSNPTRNSFDSPSPSQVVPQMNTDPYDHHSIASTPSSGSYLPPINSIAPSSNGSLISSHSPEGSDPSGSHGASTSYHQQPPILNFVATTSQHANNGSSHSNSTSSVDAMDDLNSIDMTQLISNASSISTEQYLAVHSVMPPTYQDQSQSGQLSGYHEQGSSGHGMSQGHYIQGMVQGHKGVQQNHVQQQAAQPCVQYTQETSYGVHRPHPSHPTHNSYQQHSNGNYPPPSWVDPNQQQHYRVGYGHQPASQMSSSTPDSGIQSIDGSPPSTSAFTPPMMVSPYAAQGHIYETTLNSGNRNTILQPMTTTQNDEDDVCDYSDMPTLIPVDQMTHEDDLYSDAPPVITPSSNSTKSFEPGSIPKRNSMEAITPISIEMSENLVATPQQGENKVQVGIVNIQTTNEAAIVIPATSDAKELAKHLLSAIDPKVLKEIAGTLLQGEPITIQTQEAISINYVDEQQPSTSLQSLSKSVILPEPQPSFSMSIDVEPPPPSSTPIKPTPQPSPAKPQETEPEVDEETLNRIAEYRRQARAKMQNRLQSAISSLEAKFDVVHLDLGKTIHLPLPWQHLDWKKIAERLAKRSTYKVEKPTLSKKYKKLEEHRRKRKSDESEQNEVTSKKKEKVVVKEEVEEKSEKKRKREKKFKKNEDVARIDDVKEKPTASSLKITIVRRDSEISIKSLENEKPEKVEKMPKKEEKVRSRSRSLKDDYTKIRSNIMINQPGRIPDPDPCTCSTTNPCTSTSTCPHRPLRIECSSITCRLHSQCANRRIQNNESVTQLQTFKTSNKGLGVRAKEEIHTGQYICEYNGEVVTRGAYEERMAKRKSEMPRFGVELVAGYVVDATKKGNISRFMNHSCEPNCEMQKWVVNGQYRLGIFAKQDIPPGQELTYDYSLHAGTNKPVQPCLCGSPKCRETIPTASKPRTKLKPEQIDKHQLEILRAERVFLPRNLKKWSRRGKIKDLKPIPNSELSELLVKIFVNFTTFCQQKEKISKKRITQMKRAVKQVFRLASSKSPKVLDLFLLERFDAAIKSFIQLFSRLFDKRRSDAIKSHYSHLKRQNDLSKFSGKLTKDAILVFLEEKHKLNSSPKKEKKMVSGEADLSYMDSKNLVGSYDPDKEARLSGAMEEEDCVRCICGIMEDDGEEVQCDKCKFWLHIDCVNRKGVEDEDFICPFCIKKLKSTPAVDIILTPQPEMKFEGCTYYRTLVNARGIQVRVNEAVYVERLINDKHKLILKKLHEDCAKPLPGRKMDKSKENEKNGKKIKESKETGQEEAKNGMKKEFHRKDLRTFRVERLFMSPNGQRFVFGCYYARPHETFCDPSKMFYQNELFWTPLFDTLPLDAVVGRCLILDPSEWVKGRPKSPKYLEEDVFICEYQIDKNQRSFEKLNTKNKYSINTDRYVFDEFKEKPVLKRNFTPFILPAHHQTKLDKNEAKDKIETLFKKTSDEHLTQICANLPLTSSSGHRS